MHFSRCSDFLLVVLYGSLDDRQRKNLKDDGCSTDHTLLYLGNQNRKSIKIIKKFRETDHSSKKATERTFKIVVRAETQAGKHTYHINLAISKCRYFILLEFHGI